MRPTPFTFAPGPSQISPETRADARQALEDGVLSMSHRSAGFDALSADTVAQLRRFLGIPPDYRVLYAASATDAMQMLVRNCSRRSTFHWTCGAFSELFARVSAAEGRDATQGAVPWGEANGIAEVGPFFEAEHGG